MDMQYSVTLHLWGGLLYRAPPMQSRFPHCLFPVLNSSSIYAPGKSEVLVLSASLAFPPELPVSFLWRFPSSTVSRAEVSAFRIPFLPLWCLSASLEKEGARLLIASQTGDAPEKAVPRGRRSMEEGKVEPAALLLLDQGQIKKATQALLAYNADKQKSGDKVLLDVDQNVFLMVTVWKIPPKEQVIKINLPHSILPDTSEVCLFTKDEPGLTAEQTETMYKKLLDQHGITRINEVISYKTFKTEYKPFEAKRRLLNRFALFLSDDRIRRLLPSQMGKHFYQCKKAPLCVDLKAKDLAKEINKRIHGTILPVTNKGSCYMVRIGHTSMEASEITENVMAAAKAIAIKAPQIWKSVKVLHLKTSKSIALPVFHSSLHDVAAVQKKKGAGIQRTAKRKKKRSKTKPKTTDQADTKDNVSGALEADMPKMDGVEPTALESKEEEEEDIPQLVPMETQPAEKKEEQVAKLRVSEKNQLETGLPRLRSKRKTSLSAEIPVSQPEIPGEATAIEKSNQQRPGRKSKMPKEEFLGKTQSKDAQQSLAKPTVVPKRLKAPKSDKKPKTPKRELRKMKLPLSL